MTEPDPKAETGIDLMAAAIAPFAAYARAAVTPRSAHLRDGSVIAKRNGARITIGDCRKLVSIIDAVPTAPEGEA